MYCDLKTKRLSSVKIDPWHRFTPIPPYKKVLYRAALSGRRGRYAHVYGICAPFYCISLKIYIYVGLGYNAARGLIIRDIANLTLKN